MPRSDLVVGAVLACAGIAGIVVVPGLTGRDARGERTARAIRALDPPADVVWIRSAAHSDLAGRLAGLPSVATVADPGAALRAFARIAVVEPGGVRPTPGLIVREAVDTGGGYPLRVLSPGTPYRLLQSLGDVVEGAMVTLRSPGTAAPCPWDAAARRHRCPGPEWLWIGERTMVAAGRERRCLWGHPPPTPGAWIEVSVPALDVGDRLVVVGALADGAVAKPDGASVNVVWRLDDGTGQVATFVNRRGWQEVPADTTPGRRALTLRIETADPAVRHFCFDVEARSRR